VGRGVGFISVACMDKLPVVLILMTDTASERDNSLSHSLVYGAYLVVTVCKLGLH
jgi:hypothetical protein